MKRKKGSKGQINNQLYYLSSICRTLIPRCIRVLQQRILLRGWQSRPDADLIRQRVGFYCQRPVGDNPDGLTRADKISLKESGSHYYFDLQRFLRAFSPNTLLRFFPGDVWVNPELPTVMKARRIDNNTPNATLLNLDRRRHFLRPTDPIPFEEKKPILFFRGEIHGKPGRVKFFERYFDASFTDLGDTSPTPSPPGGERWLKPRVPLIDNFNYRFILCLEGNDVASALQWVMASNCVPVMPKPTVEGWLMHSRLLDGVHYIMIADDFSDLDEKMRYYLGNPDKAAEIARNSRIWAEQFLDTKREKIISHLTLMKYFGQKI